MSESRDLAIVAAIVARLKASGAVASASVYEARAIALTGDDVGLPAIDVTPESSESAALDMLGVTTLWTHRISVTVLVAESDSTQAHRAADAISAIAHAALMTDPTLGGIVETTTLASRSWRPESSGRIYCALEHLYQIEHIARDGDLTIHG